MAYKFTKKQIRDAVSVCNGTYVDLGRHLLIPNGLTAKKHLEKHPDLVAIFQEKKDAMVDIAEGVIMDLLESPSESVRLNAATFILKSVGKHRWGDSENTESKLVELVDRLISNAQST